MSWHADPRILISYRDGGLSQAHATSLEAHVLACEPCRRRLNDTVELVAGDRLELLWSGIVDVTDAPRPGAVERLLVHLRVPDHVARLLAATPSLQLSWLVAVAATLLVAVAMARGASGDAGVVLFLLIAPVLPVVGIAAAFGPGVDPTYEIGVASPLSGFSLLVLRASAVLASTTALAGVASLAVPGAGSTGAAWLLPALGLTTATVALSTWFSPVTSAVALTTGWATLGTLALRLRTARLDVDADAVGQMFAFRPAGQLLFALLTAAAALVILRRRNTLELGRLT